MSWREQASCRGSNHLFYGSVFPYEDEPWTADPAGLAAARAICSGCPVRRECAVAILEQEDGLAIEERYGLTAGLTPQQRWSLSRRNTMRCKCGYVRDPLDLLAGRLECPRCTIDLVVPGIPETGDRWAKRHTTLARKLIAWLIEHTERGDKIPNPTKMAPELGATLHDVIRVYEGLVADGTLMREGRRYTRIGALGAADSWYCPYLDN
jgi:hypothetical protein